MTTRQHLQELHRKAAEHHIAVAKGHRALGKLFAKAEGIESGADIASAHEGLAQEHADQSQFHLECCKSLMGKVAGMADDGDSLVPLPDGLSSVYKSDHNPTYRAIPRNGSPSLSADLPGSVPVEFAQMVSVEDEE